MSLENSVHSKVPITLIINLRHCISYDETLHTDTTWTKNLIKKEYSYIMIPTNITSGFITQAAADNANYSKENNSQRVTDVFYQYGDVKKEKSC